MPVEHFDVVCVGGAMMGSSVAYFLTEHPDFDGTVAVIEPDWSYANAQTTRAQNSIREQFTNPLNIALSQFGMEFMADFEHNVAVNGHAPALNFSGTGYLFLAEDEAAYQRLALEAEVQRSAGASVDMLRPEEVAARFPYMDPSQIAGARAGSTKEGSFDGWALFQGLRQRAIHNGAVYRRDRVVDISVRSDRAEVVQLESGDAISAGWVINTAGCRAAEVAAMVDLPLPVEPRARTSFVFACRKPIAALFPLTVTPAGVHFRREQHHYMCGAVPDHDVAISPDDLAARTDEFVDKIWPVLARYVPQFDQVQVVASWGGQYDYNTLDHNLVLGTASQVPNFVFANGLSGHGLQQGPAIGRGISELIIHGEYQTIDLAPLGYDRITRGEPSMESAVI